MRSDYATWLLIQLLLWSLNRRGAARDLSVAMRVLLLNNLSSLLTRCTRESLTRITLMYWPISWNLSLTIIWCCINELMLHRGADYMRATLRQIIILALRLEDALAANLLVLINALNITNNANWAVAFRYIDTLIFLIGFLITRQIRVSLNSFWKIAPNKFLTYIRSL